MAGLGIEPGTSGSWNKCGVRVHILTDQIGGGGYGVGGGLGRGRLIEGCRYKVRGARFSP